MSTENIVKSIIQIKIIEALNKEEDLIEKLINAAIEKPIDSDGRFGGYNSKMPYIDYVIGEEVRSSAKKAIQELLAERSDEIKKIVKEKVNLDSIADDFLKNLLDTSDEQYRILLKVSDR